MILHSIKYLSLYFSGVSRFFFPWNTELQSTFELIDNIEFEEKVDIEDLGSHSEPTGIPNLETIDIKEEPLQWRK